MNIVFFTALGVGGATVFGAIIGFIFSKFVEKYAATVISFASGVMLATSIFNLIIPSVEVDKKYTVFVSVAGIFCGSFFIRFLDIFTDRLIKVRNQNSNEKLRRIILFVAAIAVHNLPEGIAAGVGFGTGNTADALIIAGSIAFQNLPEGMVIISPMLSVGISRSKTFIIALFTGIIEIVGTLFGFYATTISTGILPFVLSFAGGTMIYVIYGDMTPDSHSKSVNDTSSYSLILGFCLMLLLNEMI